MYALKYLVLYFFSVSVLAAPRNEERVKVSLYYESMCKKSHIYFVEELYPTYLTLGNVLDVELVPYGKATHLGGRWIQHFSYGCGAYPKQAETRRVSSYFFLEYFEEYNSAHVFIVEFEFLRSKYRHQENGTWVITCHHGAPECYSDKFQACVINKKYSPEQTLDFVNCMLTGENDESTAKDCVDRGMLDWPSLNTCVNGEEGNNLLAALGEKQDALPEKLRFMPWILINDVFDEEVYQQARSDLLGLVCGLLSNEPSGCNKK